MGLQLMQLVVRLSEDADRRGQDLEADSLAELLVQKGHTVTVRTALGGRRRLRVPAKPAPCVPERPHPGISCGLNPRFAERFARALPSHARRLACVPDKDALGHSFLSQHPDVAVCWLIT